MAEQQQTLFTSGEANAPLASRRPQTLDEFVGQEHLFGRGARCCAS